ncbi:unnamed protein product [Sphenostylis stenocarpa]|uniref:S-protein homolog n=1 Tax=Sphenostylis stenocarpa TaxID=92480 RepID=A0AA86SAS1_9FABA|nr:unnamed protein product [Sphenostylis stenocarpa]
MLKALVTVVAVLMMMNMVQSEKEGGDGLLSLKRTVRVTNDLTNGIVLLLRCRSRDNDLGIHALGSGEYQEWTFRDNLAHTTLFWCAMRASNVQLSFEIYSYKTDNLDCDTECYRSFRNDGAYFYIQDQKKWEKRQSWNIPQLHVF